MNILFAGDSLIEYFDWQEHFPDHRVANFGLAGESVQGLLGRVVKFQELFPKAEMVFLMTGINNVAMGDNDIGGFYRIIIEKIVDSYPDAGIYVNSILPVAVDFIDNSAIIEVNDSLKRMTKELGVSYVDLHRKFMVGQGHYVREYLMDDGLHLSRTGYDVWASTVAEMIAAKG